MYELNIENIWQQAKPAADKHYAHLRPQLHTIARQNSRSVWTRLHRNIKVELVVNVVLLIAMSTFLWDIPKGFLALFIGYSLLTLWISFRFWEQLRQKLATLPSMNVREALAAQVALLRRYKHHLWNYSISLLPFTVFVGFVGGYYKGGQHQIYTLFESSVFWITTIVFLVLMAIGYLLLRWYFRFFIDKNITALEAIQHSLEKEIA